MSPDVVGCDAAGQSRSPTPAASPAPRRGTVLAVTVRHRAPLRALRTTALVTTSVGLGSVAHSHAGGPTAHPAALAVVALLLAIPVGRLSRGPVRARVALTVLVAGQLLVHVCTLAARPPSAARIEGAHLEHAGSIAAVGSATTHDHLGLDGRMLAGHLLVALLVAVLWARGEEILCAVADRLVLPAVAVWTEILAPVVDARLTVALPWVRLETTRVRGPPSA